MIELRDLLEEKLRFYFWTYFTGVRPCRKLAINFIYLHKSRKHCGKRRKCWVPAISYFIAMFSKLSVSELLTLYHTIPTFNYHIYMKPIKTL